MVDSLLKASTLQQKIRRVKRFVLDAVDAAG
jgi:hypothetical protein